MWKSLAVVGIGFLTLLAVLILIGIGLAKRQSGVSRPVPRATVASDWARSMLQKYPYESGAYSGVLPASSVVMVWVVGRRITPKDGQTNGSFTIEMKNDRATITGNLSKSVLYSVQDGDDFTAVDATQKIDPKDIFFGDYVAARTTYFNDFPFILEVRKLNRPTKNQ